MGKGQNGAPGLGQGGMIGAAMANNNPTGGVNVTDIIRRQNQTRALAPFQTPNGPAGVAVPGIDATNMVQNALNTDATNGLNVADIISRINTVRGVGPAPTAQPPAPVPPPAAPPAAPLAGAPGMIQNALNTDAENGVNVADIIARLRATSALNPAMAGGPQTVPATPIGSNGPRAIADRRRVTGLRPTRPY